MSTITGADGLARPLWAATDPLLRDYYDTEWGMPVRDEQGLFERISLEAFQSGLSWATILRKRPAFRAAFCDFDPEQVTGFGEGRVEKLLETRPSSATSARSAPPSPTRGPPSACATRVAWSISCGASSQQKLRDPGPWRRYPPNPPNPGRWRRP